MTKILVCLIFLVGCSTIPENSFVEGTSITLGLYIPYNGTVYGLQCFNFLSGTKMNFNSNSVEYVSSSTNSIFGSSTSYCKGIKTR